MNISLSVIETELIDMKPIFSAADIASSNHQFTIK
jgi:hypothetical protein